MVEALSVSDIADHVVSRVNHDGGWSLVVWSKSAHGEGDTGIKPPRSHLVRLFPSNMPLQTINIIKAQRY